MFRTLFGLILAISFLNACSSSEKIDTSTAKGAYELGEKYRKDERFEEAIAQFSDAKNKFPYSRYATLAELAIADIHYEREAFIEAQNAYQVFKELHPKHEKIDYATFRLGMSYFNQLPDTIDRDLSLANQATLYFDEVIESYPNSEYAAPAKENKIKALKMLAEKEMYIAHFYFIRDKYDSALGRYEDLLRRHAGLGYDAKALYGAAVSAAKVRDKRKTSFYFEKLVENYPDSTWAKKAQEELKDELN